MEAAANRLLPYVVVSLPHSIETPIPERADVKLLSTDFPPMDGSSEERSVVETDSRATAALGRRTESQVLNNGRNNASVDVIRKPKWHEFCRLWR